MERKSILPGPFDSGKARMPPLNNVFMSNHLDLLADALKENLFVDKSGGILRTIVVIPSHTVKDFLIQHLIEKLGFVFGLRFLTLPQAVEYFTKLTRRSDRKIPNHYCLMLHLLSLLTEEPSAGLKQYLQNDSSKVLSLAEEMSHVFLHYGLYGGDALIKWEEQKGWQQDLWKKMKSHWDFPCDLFNHFEPPSIFHRVHFFDLSFIPPLYQKFFTLLEGYWDIFYYYRCPTPHFWGDTLSKRAAALFDQRFEKKGVSEKERIDFASLANDAHPLIANLASSTKHLYNFLIEKPVTENFLPFEETSLLSCLKNDIYSMQMRNLTVDDSIEICQAPSKLREVEALLHQLQKFHHEHSLKPKEAIVYLIDVDQYLPFIQLLFECEDSPFGYRVLDLSARLQNKNLQTIEHFFKLLESRFEPDTVFELLSSKAIKTPFPKEDLSYFQKLVELANVQWGFDEKMRAEILEIKAPSKGGTWVFAFDTFIESLPYLTSPIDLSKAESLGEFIHFITTLHEDLWSFKKQERTLQAWIESVQSLLQRYFIDVDEVHSFLKEFCKIKPLSDLLKENLFSFNSMQKIFKEIFLQKGETESYQDKPVITFAPLGEGMISSFDLICILGLSEEAFPRKTTHRSINELKNVPGSDAQPNMHEKDRLFFLQAILAAKKKLYLSFVGFSDSDGKELGPSILIEELLQIIPNLTLHKEPPFVFSKQLMEKTHYSKKNFSLANAYYFEKDPPPALAIAESALPEVVEIDIKALIKLAKHPLQFYCNQALGIFFDKEEKKEEREFILSYLDQAILKNKALTESPEKIIQEAKAKNLLPTALLHTVALSELQEDMNEVESFLKSFTLQKEDFLTIRFDPACTTPMHPTLNSYILPALKLKRSCGQTVIIHGSLPNITRRGVFSQGKQELKEAWKYLPHLLLLANAGLSIPSAILFGKSGTEKLLLQVDAKEALLSFIDYYLDASKTVSPLMPDLVEAYAKGELKQLTSSYFIEDPYREFLSPTPHEKWTHHAGALCKIIS